MDEEFDANSEAGANPANEAAAKKRSGYGRAMTPDCEGPRTPVCFGTIACAQLRWKVEILSAYP